MEKQLTLPKQYWNKTLVVDIICFAYFLLFLYVASSKLLAYEKSELEMSKSPIITDFAFLLVWLVPTIETIIAILLMIKRTIMFALYSALALMSLFTAYIIAILNFSDTIPCSCGGVLEKMSWNEHLVFNIIFMLMAIIAIVLQTKINEKEMA